jgi:rubrerythrin
MARTAARFGAVAPEATVGDLPVRDLFEVALENAVEGCVRETFGALTATYQADRATDPKIARLMRGIAKDETRHAALAWEIASWVADRLSPEERARIDAAQREAAASLRHALEGEPLAAAADRAGAPRARTALALFDAVAPTLWS